jgi:hypothetical protein
MWIKKTSFATADGKCCSRLMMYQQKTESSSPAPPSSATHVGSIVLNLDFSPAFCRAIQSQLSKLDCR